MHANDALYTTTPIIPPSIILVSSATTPTSAPVSCYFFFFLSQVIRSETLFLRIVAKINHQQTLDDLMRSLL